jgi:hypothetical protein
MKMDRLTQQATLKKFHMKHFIFLIVITISTVSGADGKTYVLKDLDFDKGELWCRFPANALHSCIATRVR